MYSKKEYDFMRQSDEFVKLTLELFCLNRLDDLPFNNTAATALYPVIINDYKCVSNAEKRLLKDHYYGVNGVAVFYFENHAEWKSGTHPILIFSEQVQNDLPLKFPLSHPMELHSEAISRFGSPDGTLKIYDLDTDGSKKYREQAETSEQFDAHNDGLGYAGDVEAFILYGESPPIWGGYTYFQNMLTVALQLRQIDEEAFNSLFLPDAITALRPRGKGAIKVTSPVLFLNEDNSPSAFLRITTGEYDITWRSGTAPLTRAKTFIEKYVGPFTPNSSFAHLNVGMGVIVRNQQVIHGRTHFIDGSVGPKRRLARKWFMRQEESMAYKHVPGIRLRHDFAAIYPNLFGPDMLEGEWNYNLENNRNIRIR
jgi:Taurine catabolism dioxygenase TauD, TfdA family